MVSRGTQFLHQFDLGKRLGIADIERFTYGAGFGHGPNHGMHQVIHVDELHQAMAFAWQNNGPIGAETIPEKCLAVERIAWTVDERRAQRDNRKPRPLMEPEQCPLAHGLIARVRVRVVVRRKSVAFVMV